MNDHLAKLLHRQRSLSLLRKKVQLEKQAILDPLKNLLHEEAEQVQRIERLQRVAQRQISQLSREVGAGVVKTSVSGRDLSSCFAEAYAERQGLKKMSVLICQQRQQLEQLRVEADGLLKEVGKRMQQDKDLLQEMKMTKSELNQLADIVEAEAIAEIAPFLDPAIYARGAA